MNTKAFHLKIFKNILKKLSLISKPDLEWNYSSGKSIEEQKEDPGTFQYNDEGFTYTRGDFIKTLKWSEITALNVFKIDLVTLDEIRMEIVFGDTCIEISEETPGWYQFISKTKEIFPIIPKSWDFEITQPPFERNYKTIYSKSEDTFGQKKILK